MHNQENIIFDLLNSYSNEAKKTNCLQNIFFKKLETELPGLSIVVHVYNTNFSGDRGRRIEV
jgi:hypothetical protein